MASGKKPASPDASAAPWAARGVSGVVPPGRRLSEAAEKRRARWSASGVDGVAPPGNQEPGEGPAAEWVLRHQKTQKRPGKPALGRPGAGAEAQGDPADLKTFLELFAEFFRTHPLDPENAQQLGQLIAQSHAPFEILIAFTILSAHVGTEGPQRKKHQWSLERGAKVFYNLAKRLDASVRPPRGLVPKTVDPLFFDLPRTAMQIPFAYATDAFLRTLELYRGDTNRDRLLMRFARQMRDRFIEHRTFGDQPLARLFPWNEPAWAPEE